MTKNKLLTIFSTVINLNWFVKIILFHSLVLREHFYHFKRTPYVHILIVPVIKTWAIIIH